MQPASVVIFQRNCASYDRDIIIDDDKHPVCLRGGGDEHHENEGGGSWAFLTAKQRMFSLQQQPSMAYMTIDAAG